MDVHNQPNVAYLCLKPVTSIVITHVYVLPCPSQSHRHNIGEDSDFRGDTGSSGRVDQRIQRTILSKLAVSLEEKHEFFFLSVVSTHNSAAVYVRLKRSVYIVLGKRLA